MPAIADILPSFPAIWSFRTIQDTDVTRSLSGKIYARERGLIRFEITLQAMPMAPEKFSEISSFLAQHSGPANRFYVKVDQPLTGAIVQKGNYVNWSTDADGKLYLVTDATSVPVSVVPTPPSTGDASTLDAHLLCAAKSNTQQVQWSRNGLVSFSLTLEEHLQ